MDDSVCELVTPQVLALLRHHGARATFFAIGSAVEHAGEVGRHMLAAIPAGGHELGNHTMYDKATWRLPDEVLRHELAAVDGLIERAHADAGVPRPRVRWFRPGHGWFNARVLDAVEAAGYRTALGDVFPYDPTVPYWRLNAWMVLRNVRPGSIIILHDQRPWLVPTLQAVLPELRRRGYEVVTLTQLWEMRRLPAGADAPLLTTGLA